MSEIEIQWPMPPPAWVLGAGEVHVWAASLDRDAGAISAFAKTLSPDEQARAARYHFERDRNRFIIGRGSLRKVLGRCLATSPESLRFEYSVRGKPWLAASGTATTLHFNLAHSHGIALLAVTRAGAVGVDVEKIGQTRDFLGIAERFFSPGEIAALNSLPPDEHPAGFFNLWTCKEAWLKATGEGIGGGLDQVEVSLGGQEPARLLRLFGDSSAAANWTLRELDPAPGFKAAVALQSTGLEIRCWKWADAIHAVA